MTKKTRSAIKMCLKNGSSTRERMLSTMRNLREKYDVSNDDLYEIIHELRVEFYQKGK
jgi:hypothetical protein